MSGRSIAAALFLVLAGPLLAVEPPVLTTGITGLASGTGLEDPQYVLSLVPVQKLMLAVARQPLTRSEVATRLMGTGVTPESLVGCGLLTEDGERFRLAYVVLTKEDQEHIYAVSRALGSDLASKLAAHKPEFDRLLAEYPYSALRPQLAFGLVAGMVLNWQGLSLATRLGFRVDPKSLPGGRRYLVHSEEIGARTPTEGLYWGSHTFPGPTISLSTFGDGPSIPRTKGLPDVLTDPIEEGLRLFDHSPSIRSAVQESLVPHLTEAVADAGRLMEAVANGSSSKEELSRLSSIPPERLTATLDLLVAIDYLKAEDGKYTLQVPVLTTRDRGLVDAVVALGTGILSEWMTAHHQPLKAQLRDLTPIRSGLPYELVFNEVWHYTFGWTTKELAERGFYQDPRAAGYPRKGYVPLVWESSLFSAKHR